MNIVFFAAVVLRLSNTDSPQAIQELATVTRSTADLRDLSVNVADRSITFNGTPEQNHIAEWLVPRLDVRGARPVSAEYKAGNDDIVRVFYISHVATPQQLSEIVTTARSVAEVPRAFIYQTAKALVARGTAEQIGLMEWLLPQLDVPAPQTESPQHNVGGRTDDIARVFYLNNAQAVQDLQELTTLVRTITEIRRAFTYNAVKAVAMRGSADQIALAEFLITHLNKRAGEFVEASTEYRMIGEPEGVVRLFVVNSPSIEAFQQRVRNVRTTTGIRRAFTFSTHRAFAVRGTPEQILEVQRLLKVR
jgi:hypothetical protein